MHPDQEHSALEPYWHHDQPIGALLYFGQPTPVRIKAHLFTERYDEPGEINWFHLNQGERTYVFMRPYLTLPSTVPPARATALDPDLDDLFPSPESARIHERAIGTASAAYYPAVHGLLVWQFHLSDPFRPEDPAQDATYQALWLGMEELLLELLPDTRFLVTPRWDPTYPERTYERFLVAVGYLPHLGHEQLFIKSRSDAQEDA